MATHAPYDEIHGLHGGRVPVMPIEKSPIIFLHKSCRIGGLGNTCILYANEQFPNELLMFKSYSSWGLTRVLLKYFPIIHDISCPFLDISPLSHTLPLLPRHWPPPYQILRFSLGISYTHIQTFSVSTPYFSDTCQSSQGSQLQLITLPYIQERIPWRTIFILCTLSWWILRCSGDGGTYIFFRQK